VTVWVANSAKDRRMRIQGTTGLNGSPSAVSARRTASSSFSLPPQESTPAQTSSASALRMVGGIEALMALQGVEDPAERRRRSVAKGRYALDVLEELKLGVLSGSLDSGSLGRLKSAAEGLKDTSGDGNLDGVLAEIELRVEVELAKMQLNRAV
jgi:hypothetical protein